MSDQWFVRPETERLDLGGNQWVEIKKELNYGEFREFKKNAGISLTEINFSLDNLFEYVHPIILAYAVNWSVQNGDGKTAEISESVINAMHTDKAFDMGLKIVTHIGALALEKKATKKKAPRKKRSKQSETSSS